ncbi:hypothetical protein [Rheinheimera baltica]|uniref:hypothetical protein n=1 Tax=Rheinheimera baltica TaxID=67576 RepID=UPI00273D7A5A|nr:hypothetical protein [Rheinheimera baltica]MDP5188353.1 hypothetical protein [Rheinheimera baltica]
MPADTTKAPASAGVSASTDISAAAVEWWKQARVLAYNQLQLFTLEGERVAISMVALLVFGLLAGLLALSLWFAVLVQVHLFALYCGFSASQALGVVMVALLLGLWAVLRRCRYYSRLLRFPATMQSLKSAVAAAGE